jgi:hypothetical protein
MFDVFRGSLAEFLHPFLDGLTIRSDLPGIGHAI